MRGKVLPASVAISIVLVLSGCASEDGSSNSVPTASMSASVAASPTAEAAPPENPDDALEYTLTGLPIEGVVNDGKGDYQKTTIRADDPIMIYDPAKADDMAKELFTAEELQEAQATIVRSIAEEFLDSTLNGNPTPETRQAWWDEHETMFHSVAKEDLKKDFLTYDQAKAPLITGEWRKDTFGLVYGADQLHIDDRMFSNQKVFGTIDEATGTELVAVSMDYLVRYNNQFVTGDVGWGELYGPVTWAAGFEDGEWKLSGYGGNTIAIAGEGKPGDETMW